MMVLKKNNKKKTKNDFNALLLILMIVTTKNHGITALSSSNTLPPINNDKEWNNNKLNQDSSSSSFSSSIKGKMILAPLTRGGNLPFRRLCSDLFGMEVGLSEMIYARSLLKGNPVEKARLRRAEKVFGVQIATNNVQEGCDAIREARNAGADFVDLNCGCPIYEATRRGLGSSLLRSPAKLGKLVKGLVQNGDDMPVTVKIRLGCEAGSINCNEVVKTLCEAGAAAVTIHGRTAQQGYSKNADWNIIQNVVNENNIHNKPIFIGNGDILTRQEARRRMEENRVDSVMVGRGALIKPWLFQEFNDNETWLPSIQERIGVYRALTLYMKDHFGNDEMGRTKSWNFLPWHFDFFNRYYYTNDDSDTTTPLIQSRWDIPDDELSTLSSLDKLMMNRCDDAHNLIAAALWESDSDDDAVRKLTSVAEGHEFQQILVEGNNEEKEEDQVLTNLPEAKGRWAKRRGRNPGPKRTEEEIAAIRAQRAAKKSNILAEGGVWPPN